MLNVSDINSSAWQISAGEYGDILQDVADISQSIALILNTIPGSDPLRPGFGSYLFSHIDTPINIAAPAIKKTVSFDIESWEPRIRVKRVEVALSSDDNYSLDITVIWQMLSGRVSGTAFYTYTPTGVSISQPPAIAFINPETSGVSATTNWQISAEAFGSTVEGANEISQAIALAVSTIQGSDLLRPVFGSNLWQYVDSSLQTSAAPIAAAIRAAVDIWEPRAKISRISYAYQTQPDESTIPSGIIYRIAWRLKAGDIEGQTDLLLQNEGTETAPPSLIIRILGAETGEAITTEADQYIQI